MARETNLLLHSRGSIMKSNDYYIFIVYSSIINETFHKTMFTFIRNNKW